jgi:nicotinamidase-related amidase
MKSDARALVVIDVQNDYFSGGAFPLWNAEETLAKVLAAMERAKAAGVPVVLVRHVVGPDKGPGPFFNAGTHGAKVHPAIRDAAGSAAIVIKTFADSFLQTDLEQILTGYGTTELLICGMMTQNCVTHTAISKTAEKYKVTVLADCCTTVSEMIHLIALNALAPRVGIATAAETL